jgi:hypothetical protein
MNALAALYEGISKAGRIITEGEAVQTAQGVSTGVVEMEDLIAGSSPICAATDSMRTSKPTSSSRRCGRKSVTTVALVGSSEGEVMAKDLSWPIVSKKGSEGRRSSSPSQTDS